MKSKLLINCIFSLLLVGSSITVSAAPATSDASTQNTSYSSATELPDVQNTKIVLDMENMFAGEGMYHFDYSSGYLKFEIENTGSKALQYRVKYPCGCKLVSGRMEAGSCHTFEYFDPTLHGSNYGHTPIGNYSIYIYNDDGSLSSVKLFAQTIQQ